MAEDHTSDRGPGAAAAIGSATVLSAAGEPRVAVRLDGPCLTETLLHLEKSGGNGSLSRATLGRITDQASALVTDIIAAYARRVAVGEVGADGSARASADPPTGDDCPTGLLYGRIQSGKTLAMIVATAMAIDNGFRVVVVLTANNLKLVDQTGARFQVLEGPLVHSSNVTRGDEFEWEADRVNVERWLASRGAVFICAKESNHQRNLIGFLREIGAAEYPALIWDDEADHATPDTTRAARGQQRPTAPPHGSTTYRLTVENDAAGEPGESIRETLRHNVFVPVTATPYALFLQDPESPLRPEFTALIEPGEGYRGGESFFEAVSDIATPPLVYVDDNEFAQLNSGVATAPEGLARSIAFFLLSAAAHARAVGDWPDKGYKHLSHTSPRTDAHDRLADLLLRWVDDLAGSLEAHALGATESSELTRAHEELSKTVPAAPPLQVLLEDIRRKLPRRKIITVNAQARDRESPFGSGFNFMVGGNILGRGLTIDDLLVTYYLRKAQVQQMDTMLQHARMYGYREPLMPYTRVFLPSGLAVRFRSIHESETALRAAVENHPDATRVPVWVLNGLRPTRPGIVDMGTVATYRGGQHLFPVQVVYQPARLNGVTEQVDRLVRNTIGDPILPRQFVRVPIEAIARLVELVPVDDDEPSIWDPEAIRRVLLSIGGRYNGVGALYTRQFGRGSDRLTTGAFFGEELAAARDQGVPVLALFRDDGTRRAGVENPFAGAPFWYPSIVFPSGMPHQLFNASR